MIMAVTDHQSSSSTRLSLASNVQKGGHKTFNKHTNKQSDY